MHQISKIRTNSDIKDWHFISVPLTFQTILRDL